VTRFETARALSLAVPAALIAGAWGSQLFGGLFPCEMCHWQRWPHYAAIGLALLAFVAPAGPRAPLVWLAALAILVSGGIGGWHAGIEYKWWEGLTQCTAPPSGSISDLINAPLIRCDEAQWRLFGISLAGFNALISGVAGLAIIRLLMGKSA
jgi:disulfide bond formation protein DsbB